MSKQLRDFLIKESQDYNARDKQKAIDSEKFPRVINWMSEKNNLFWKHNCENNKKKMTPTKRQGPHNQNEGAVTSLKIFPEPKAVKTSKDELISPKIINSHLENSKLPIVERGVQAQNKLLQRNKTRKRYRNTEEKEQQLLARVKNYYSVATRLDNRKQ